MTLPFILQINDGTNSINFLGPDFFVQNGGFDIGMPKARRTLTEIRPGIFLPTQYDYDYREGKITFEVVGKTRTAIIKKLQKLDRMITQLSLRTRLGQGEKIELQYAWKGSQAITYFEVYGMDFKFPDDVLSVEKLHVKRTGTSNISSGGSFLGGPAEFYVPDCEIALYLSPYGYGYSIRAAAMAIPTFSSTQPGKSTLGTWVQNPTTGSTDANFIRIRAADLAGSGPMPTKIALHMPQFIGGDPNLWNAVYIGHQAKAGLPPDMSNLRREAEDAIINRGSIASGGSGGYHVIGNDPGSNPWVDAIPSIEFFPPTDARLYGLYYAIMLTKNKLPSKYQAAIGYNGWGIDQVLTWVKPNLGGLSNPVVVPLGAVMMPPPGPDYHKLPGTAQYDPPFGAIRFGVSFAEEGTQANFTCDYLYLLPIDSGLRMWNFRGEILGTVGEHTNGATTVDDGWKGLQYVNTGGPIDEGFQWRATYNGLMNPIRLIPGVENRLYFFFAGHRNFDTRSIRGKVHVYGVPTYQALAL